MGKRFVVGICRRWLLGIKRCRVRVNYQLDLGGVRLRFTYDFHSSQKKAVPHLSFGFPDDGALFGTLAMQLLFVTSNSEGAVKCSSCGTPFLPRKRPRTGHRHFCDRPSCGRRAAVRYASRDFRRKHPKYRQQYE
jgi:hypothetical protein